MKEQFQQPTVGRVVFGPLEAPMPRPDMRAISARSHSANLMMQPCNCMGPQPGQTKCPCALRAESEQGAQMVRDGVTINGRRYRLVAED